LIPTLIAKEMERLKSESLGFRGEIEQRQKILADIMERIGPNEPLSVGFLKMLSDLTSVFDSVSDEDLPDDDDDDDEDKIETVMKNIIKTNENDEHDVTDNKNDDHDDHDETDNKNDDHDDHDETDNKNDDHDEHDEHNDHDEDNQSEDRMYYLDMKPKRDSLVVHDSNISRAVGESDFGNDSDKMSEMSFF
jgi:hypothetical protein